MSNEQYLECIRLEKKIRDTEKELAARKKTTVEEMKRVENARALGKAPY